METTEETEQPGGGDHGRPDSDPAAPVGPPPPGALDATAPQSTAQATTVGDTTTSHDAAPVGTAVASGTAPGIGAPVTPEPATPPPAATVTRPTRRRWPRRLAWAILVPLVLVVLVIAAWAIDSAIGSDDVARNTELAGTPVGGMSEAELDEAVADLAAELPDADVVIDTGDLELTTTAGELGLDIDTEATTATVMDVGRTGGLLIRPVEWVQSFFTPRASDVSVTADPATVDTALAALEGEERQPPTEPDLVVTDGAAVLVPGVDGIELEAEPVLDALPSTLGDVTDEILITAERTAVPPQMGDEVIQSLVDQANAMAERTIEVTSGQQTFAVAGGSVIDGVAVDTSGDAPRLVVSEEVLGQYIAAQEGIDGNPTNVTFTIGGAGLVPVAGNDVEVCCGEGAAGVIVDALLAGEESVEVPSRTYTAADGVEWASGLGVNQVVSEFTTPHRCCQGRVTNIHRMADIVRGTLVAPGETFSLNDTVGRRTIEKGFVPAGAIIDGEHVDDVGGGVSQFATTTFNAAFFAGLPIPEYQMHSEYISRYPYAREATVFYPTVDLRFTNDTPYGIVVWPTYTDTSLTVKLYSTPHARGEQTGQSQSSGCGSITTERTTTYPDGTADVDTFRANYKRC